MGSDHSIGPTIILKRASPIPIVGIVLTRVCPPPNPSLVLASSSSFVLNFKRIIDSTVEELKPPCLLPSRMMMMVVVEGGWILMIGRLLLVMILTITSGLYAGLTIGLMGLDETTLEVIKNSGSLKERVYAERISPIRKDGYLLLVTLLLASTIINESIPIVADRFLSTGGWGAVIMSTILLLLFGEVLPQALCTKYGLIVGGKMIWLVKVSMFILYPIAYPAAKLLEAFLGKAQNGVVHYKRAELKELVSIMGGRIELAPDEVKIIRGVLDLRDKHAALIMTPLDQVFMLNFEESLDFHLIEQIIGRGYSRLPVYLGTKDNIVGMVLVKKLLSLNLTLPIPISSLPISVVPVVSITMSLFTILHDFQQGKSHLAIVSSSPSSDKGGKPIGIITLEDIIEELLQEEITDETDSPPSSQLGSTLPFLVDFLLPSSRRRVLT